MVCWRSLRKHDFKWVSIMKNIDMKIKVFLFIEPLKQFDKRLNIGIPETPSSSSLVKSNRIFGDGRSSPLHLL